ncbi:MAG: hypothetical protein C0602_08570 [Denitrovibrio sp.]|nr:MAG: hypothetical protein C0602_08570 [Denitrovibrio sp.]
MKNVNNTNNTTDDTKAVLNILKNSGTLEDKPKAGRPEKNGPKRSKSLSLKMTENECAQVKELARNANMSFTDFILKCCKIKPEQ